MHVRKRNGNLEPVDLNKILRAVTRCAAGIPEVDPARVASKTIGSIRDGATTEELDRMSIQTAASLIPENQNYSKLAASILAETIRKEVARQGVQTFSQSVTNGHALGLVTEELVAFTTANARKLDNAVKDEYNQHFEYFGLKSVYDNHLLRDPGTKLVIETPQMAFMRIAASQVKTARQAVSLYKLIATGEVELKDGDWSLGAVSRKPVNLLIEVATEAIAFRPLKPGMGVAVAERTFLRKDKATGTWETWGEVADRVAYGNALLASTPNHPSESEYHLLRKHIAKATTLMSGRHLQHGDAGQPGRPMEIHTNCSTSATSFMEFYLLLNGSGVGRCYDDDMMLVNWDNAPNIRCVLDSSHPDFIWDTHESLREAKHKYGVPQGMEWFERPAEVTDESWKQANREWEARVAAAGGTAGPKWSSQNAVWFQVPDSREGWAKALEMWEVFAFEKTYADCILVLDFSAVRPRRLPIGGMQDRPASGPGPLMGAFQKAAAIKGAGLARWKQAMFIDHYFAECVLVGGARRSARMAVKNWRDKTVLDFITVKRPIEYQGLSVEEVIALRKKLGKAAPMAFLWSSNNSILVDKEFWRLVRSATPMAEQTPLEKHAKAVFALATAAAYGDGTGEPGFINVDKLVQNDEGLTDLSRGDYIESDRFKVNEETQVLLGRLAKAASRKPFRMIVNPCSEITISLLGAYCTIVDLVPFHCDTIDEIIECARAVTRAMIRVNTMNSAYSKEVRRTNRIGIGLTGVHEFAWKFFKVGFRDLIDPDFDTLRDEFGIANLAAANGPEHFEALSAKAPMAAAAAFWLTLARINRAINEEAISYSKELGVTPPHTTITVKPSGSVSKLYGLTEGWHLPSMDYFLRWVQYRNDDPLVAEYRNNGYPVRELREYAGTTIVGFPTVPTITELGMGDKMVTAGRATPEEQYRWLMLGEKYWIVGTDEEGKPVPQDKGNSISYTLKYLPDVVHFEDFREMLLEYQPKIRCCSVMPQEDTSSYEYQPEQPISREEFDAIRANLEQSIWKKSEIKEDIGREHVDCAGGACPVDFNSGKK